MLSVIFMALAVVGRRQEPHLASVREWSHSAPITQPCYGIWLCVFKTVLPSNITENGPGPASWTADVVVLSRHDATAPFLHRQDRRRNPFPSRRPGRNA